MTGEGTSSATSRMNAAARRVEELEDLRVRLKAGDPLTEDDLAHAGQRMSEAADNARDAHHRAADAHRWAADAHLSAADLAVMTGNPELDARHRKAAVADSDAAMSEDQASRRG